MSQLRQRIAEFASVGAEVIAVSPDDQASTLGLVQRLNLPFVVLSDPELQAIDDFGARHLNEPHGKQIPRPAVFILDKDWRVRFAYVGDSVPDRPSEDVMLDALRAI